MNATQEADWLDQPTPTPHPDAAALIARIDAGKVNEPDLLQGLLDSLRERRAS